MPLKQNLASDSLATLDMREVLAVAPNATLREALALMQAKRSGCLFIVDGGRLTGIFTERDLLKRVIGKRLDLSAMISTVMTPQPAVARQDDRLAGVLRKLIDGGYRHLPVVDKAGRPIGRLSVREIVHYMVEHFPKAVYNLPPEPDQVHTAPDGA